MKDLQFSWSQFSPDVAQRYLKTFGHPSVSSKLLVVEVLRKLGAGRSLKVVDLGCGNAQLGEYFREQSLDCAYTGVDFSETLLAAARRAVPDATFIQDDVNTLAQVTGTYDVALYSHVLEILPAPQDSLAGAKRLAKAVVIRFFEPPEFDTDTVELRWMDVGGTEQFPYIRRKMSRGYYQLMLAALQCRQVDIYRDVTKDQVHVLHF